MIIYANLYTLNMIKATQSTHSHSRYQDPVCWFQLQ